MSFPNCIKVCKANLDRLICFSKGHDLLESDYNNKLGSNSHAIFWELYLAEKLKKCCGITVHKENGGVNRPDFYFDDSNRKIWIEAVTCAEPVNPEDLVSPQDDTFESCIPEENAHKIYPRLTQALNEKIIKYTKYRHKGRIAENDGAIIAINGYYALNKHPDNVPGIPIPPFICKLLFGITEQQIINGERFAVVTSEILKSDISKIPIGYFMRKSIPIYDKNTGTLGLFPTDTINGILYSNVNMCEYLKNDLAFIQNPMAKDITQYFKTCPNGIWTLKKSGDKFAVNHSPCVK